MKQELFQQVIVRMFNDKFQYVNSEIRTRLTPIHMRGIPPGACSRVNLHANTHWEHSVGACCLVHVMVHTRELIKAQFDPGSCSQIFNQFNIVEHFAGWKFCSQE